jgi:hypothetical protein
LQKLKASRDQVDQNAFEKLTTGNPGRWELIALQATSFFEKHRYVQDHSSPYGVSGVLVNIPGVSEFCLRFLSRYLRFSILYLFVGGSKTLGPTLQNIVLLPYWLFLSIF